MRCDYSPVNVLTEVEFEFELNRKRYRIHRVPEQERAKARGGGTTRQSAKAAFYELRDGEEVVLEASRVTEATSMVVELTGLRVDQFRQVMVLPQGQFRQLLMADSAEREKIFSQLFQTGIYKQIEDRLKEQAGKIRNRKEGLQERRKGILESAGLQDDAELADEVTRLTPEAAQARQALSQAEQQWLAAREVLHQAETLAQQFRRLESLRAALGKLKETEPEVARKQQAIELAEQANNLHPVHAEFVHCRDELRRLDEQLQRSQKALQQSESALQAARQEQDKMPQWRQELDGHKQKLAVLQGYEDRAQRLQRAKQELAHVSVERDRARQQEGENRKQLEATEKALRQQEQEKDDLEQSVTNETELKLQLQQVDSSIKVSAEMLELTDLEQKKTGELEQSKQRKQQVSEQHEAAGLEVKQLELLWHRGQAALLARELQFGAPCPVCGSTEHPAPARSGEQIPTEQQRRNAQSKQQRLNASLLKVSEEYSALETQLAEIHNRVSQLRKELRQNGKLSMTELEKERNVLHQALETLGAQKHKKLRLDIAIRQSRQQRESMITRWEQTRNILQEISQQYHSASTGFELAAQELPEAYREPGALKQAMVQQEQQIRSLQASMDKAQQRFVDALREQEACAARRQQLEESVQHAGNKHQRAASAWQKAIQQSVFADEQAFLAAKRDQETINRLRQEIRGYEKERQQAEGAFNDLQSRLEEHTPPDIPALQSAMQLKGKHKGEQEQAFKLLDKRLDQLANIRQKLASIGRQLEACDDEYKLVGTLSDVANGRVGHKVSLQRFVLSVLLDDVLLEASQRLQLMSKGRYRLLRKHDPAKGNKASGLELEVEDSYTGKNRPVSTLSGGESFIASLSLALGLSDVVQAYAGGIRLDTLFIDEGFGSLDADSLDLAIRTLIDLRNTGRMVGIISHVAELKEQISLRLDIETGRQGSHIVLIK